MSAASIAGLATFATCLGQRYVRSAENACRLLGWQPPADAIEASARSLIEPGAV